MRISGTTQPILVAFGDQVAHFLSTHKVMVIALVIFAAIATVGYWLYYRFTAQKEIPNYKKFVKYYKPFEPLLEKIFPKNFPFDNGMVTFLVLRFHSRQDCADVEFQLKDFGDITTPYFIPIILSPRKVIINYAQLCKDVENFTKKLSITSTSAIENRLAVHFQPSFKPESAESELVEENNAPQILNENIQKIGNAIKEFQRKNLKEETFRENLANKMKTLLEETLPYV